MVEIDMSVKFVTAFQLETSGNWRLGPTQQQQSSSGLPAGFEQTVAPTQSPCCLTALRLSGPATRFLGSFRRKDFTRRCHSTSSGTVAIALGGRLAITG